MLGEQRLVGGDDTLPRLQRRAHALIGGTVLAAHQLDEDVDRVGAREPDRVIVPGDRVEVDTAVLGPVACADACDLYRAAELRDEGVALPLDEARDGCADRAQSGDPEPERCVH